VRLSRVTSLELRNRDIASSHASNSSRTARHALADSRPLPPAGRGPRQTAGAANPSREPRRRRLRCRGDGAPLPEAPQHRVCRGHPPDAAVVAWTAGRVTAVTARVTRGMATRDGRLWAAPSIVPTTGQLR
jgi:hypothetical protein